MLYPLRTATLLLILLFATSLALAFRARFELPLRLKTTGVTKQAHTQRNQTSSRPVHAFHNAPPSEPLPTTLDPTPFADNRSAFVAYSIARRIPQPLYQVPCYCGCDRFSEHKSLLDCFTSKHAIGCHICQRGAIFTYEQVKSGKTAAEIRDAMENGGLDSFDRNKYVDDHYQEYKRTTLPAQQASKPGAAP